MRKFLTEIKTVSAKEPFALLTFAGPNVPGKSITDAQNWCDNNSMGYCNVVGELTDSIPVDGSPHTRAADEYINPNRF